MEEKNIIMTSLDLKEEYEVIDTLYVTEELKQRYPKEEYLNQMLTIAKERLKKQCRELGGNAIIGCHIIYVPTSSAKILSISGTAVKIKSKV
jgi:uncharacterized protein YbjQ (UPF0145 family)